MRLAAGLVLALAGCASLPGRPSLAAAGYCVLAVEEDGGSLAIRDGARRATVPIGERPHEVEVSADGRTAFVSQFGIADYDNRIGAPGDRVVAIDLGLGKAVGDFPLPAGVRAPHGVKLRPPGGAELYVNAEVGGDVMLVYDVARRALIRRFNLPKATHNFLFSRDGHSLVSFAGANGIARFDAATGRPLAERRFDTPIRGLRLDPTATFWPPQRERYSGSIRRRCGSRRVWRRRWRANSPIWKALAAAASPLRRSRTAG